MKFFDEWDPDGAICDWQRTGRKKLNKIIKRYNKWAESPRSFNTSESTLKLLAKIEKGKQTFGSWDGGQHWLEVLEEIEKIVRESSDWLCPTCGRHINEV